MTEDVKKAIKMVEIEVLSELGPCMLRKDGEPRSRHRGIYIQSI